MSVVEAARRPSTPAPDLAFLQRKAKQLRATCVQMSHDGKEGHLSSALSSVDLIVGLYYHWLRLPSDPSQRKNRDRFILSKGHGCTALYGALADRGFIPRESLATYATNDSTLANHPCAHQLPLLDWSTGSLGHGLGVAAGKLYGLKLDGNPARAAVLLSDGECNEGSVWEAAMFAAAHKLDRLVALVDYNGIQAVGRSDEIMGHASLEAKFRAFGWAARTIQGNRMDEVIAALNAVPFEPGRPSAIIARTVSGAGVGFMENQVLWHYRVPSAEEVSRALAELGERPVHAGGS